MQTEINGITLNILKTKNDWGVYPGDTVMPVWMQWNGKAWIFTDENTPANLKSIEREISDYIIANGK